MFKVHDNQPHFTFAHLSTITHGSLNDAGYADKIFHSFMENLFQKGYNNNSLIILFSDHGLRFGNILYTKSSIYEQRLPYFYIYIPDTMRIGSMDAKQLREVVKANQHKLTSHIDVHATLMHLLLGTPSPDEQFGLSLFTHIPDNRTCPQAGISAQYCMCQTYVSINANNLTNNLVVEITNKINKALESEKDKCAVLRVKSLNSVMYMLKDEHNANSTNDHYRLQWSVMPSKADFESTVLVDSQTGNFSIIGDIARLDKYSAQTQCVVGKPRIERFCYCIKQ